MPTEKRLLLVSWKRSDLTELHVCSIDSIEYAILYRDNDNVYLDRIEIDGDMALVYSSEHRIERIDGLQFKDCELTSIQIIK